MKSLTKWQLNKLQSIFLMIPLVSAYSFSLDLYIPLVPAIQSELNVSIQQMQLTNSLFMLTCGLGQLIFGPLSDRYGRRRILIISLLISIAANLVCFYANGFNWFLLGKILQAIGACGSYLCCFATVRDIFQKPELSAEMFSYLNVANSTSAIIAPSIGTFIGYQYGWKWIFFALMCYAAYSLISCHKFYIETMTQSKQANDSSVWQEYLSIFSHINYQVYTLPAAIGISSFFAYYSISPYLYQQTFGLSKETYSLLFGSCGLTFFISSYICSRLVRHFGITKTLIHGISCHAAGCITMIMSFVVVSSYQLIIMHGGVMLIIFGSALMVSAGIGGTMAPFRNIAGSAFALISAYKFGLCYLLGELAIAYYNETPIPLGLMLLSLNILSLAIIYYFRNKVITENISTTAEVATEMSHITDDFL